MRQYVLYAEDEQFLEDMIGGSQSVFDQTPNIGRYSSSYSSDTDEAIALLDGWLSKGWPHIIKK